MKPYTKILAWFTIIVISSLILAVVILGIIFAIDSTKPKFKNINSDLHSYNSLKQIKVNVFESTSKIQIGGVNVKILNETTSNPHFTIVTLDKPIFNGFLQGKDTTIYSKDLSEHYFTIENDPLDVGRFSISVKRGHTYKIVLSSSSRTF